MDLLTAGTSSPAVCDPVPCESFACPRDRHSDIDGIGELWSFPCHPARAARATVFKEATQRGATSWIKPGHAEITLGINRRVPCLADVTPVKVRPSMSDLEYLAFISYARGKKANAVARAAEDLISRYRPPSSVRARTDGLGRRVFFDEETATSSENAAAYFREHVQKARHLVLLCTPRTPNRPFVRLEIEAFMRARGSDRERRILPILVEGEPATSIPTVLGEVESVDGPFWIDIRAETPEQARGRLRAQKLRLLAPLLGLSLDELRHRDAERRFRNTVAASVLAALVTVGLGVATLRYARLQEDERRARSQALTQQAVAWSGQPGRSRAGIEAALDALALADSSNVLTSAFPRPPAATSALARALLMDHRIQRLASEQVVAALPLGEGGAVLGSRTGTVTVFAPDLETVQSTLALGAPIAAVALSRASLWVGGGAHHAAEIHPGTGALMRTVDLSPFLTLGLFAGDVPDTGAPVALSDPEGNVCLVDEVPRCFSVDTSLELDGVRFAADGHALALIADNGVRKIGVATGISSSPLFCPGSADSEIVNAGWKDGELWLAHTDGHICRETKSGMTTLRAPGEGELTAFVARGSLAVAGFRDGHYEGERDKHFRYLTSGFPPDDLIAPRIGDRWAAHDETGRVEIFDAAGRRLWGASGLGGGLFRGVFSPDGDRLTIVRANAAWLVSLTADGPMRRVMESPIPLVGVGWGQEGIYGCGSDAVVGGSGHARIGGTRGFGLGCRPVVDASGRRVLGYTYPEGFHLTDLESGEKRFVQASPPTLSPFALSPDGTSIAAQGQGSLRVYTPSASAATDLVLRNPADVMFVRRDRLVAALLEPTELAIFQKTEGTWELLHAFPLEAFARFSADPTGESLLVDVVGEEEVFANVFSPQARRIRVSQELSTARVALGPKGAVYARAVAGGGVELGPPGGPLQSLPTEAPATTLRFSRDGRRLAVGMANGAVTLFDLMDRQVHGFTPVEATGTPILGLAFDAEDRRLAFARGRDIFEMPIEEDAWVRAACVHIKRRGPPCGG